MHIQYLEYAQILPEFSVALQYPDLKNVYRVGISRAWRYFSTMVSDLAQYAALTIISVHH